MLSYENEQCNNTIKKIQVFYHVTPCQLEHSHLHFKRTCCLHLQGPRTVKTDNLLAELLNTLHTNTKTHHFSSSLQDRAAVIVEMKHRLKKWIRNETENAWHNILIQNVHLKAEPAQRIYKPFTVSCCIPTDDAARSAVSRRADIDCCTVTGDGPCSAVLTFRVKKSTVCIIMCTERYKYKCSLIHPEPHLNILRTTAYISAVYLPFAVYYQHYT
jgi:hypothetical protein